MPSLYDKTGREIQAGDILKVFHFIDRYRRKRFMYKRAAETKMLGKADPQPYLRIEHLTGDGDYVERLDGRTLIDYEIVAGRDDFYDRPRIAARPA